MKADTVVERFAELWGNLSRSASIHGIESRESDISLVTAKRASKQIKQSTWPAGLSKEAVRQKRYKRHNVSTKPLCWYTRKTAKKSSIIFFAVLAYQYPPHIRVDNGADGNITDIKTLRCINASVIGRDVQRLQQTWVLDMATAASYEKSAIILSSKKLQFIPSFIHSTVLHLSSAKACGSEKPTYKQASITVPPTEEIGANISWILTTDTNRLAETVDEESLQRIGSQYGAGSVAVPWNIFSC